MHDGQEYRHAWSIWVRTPSSNIPLARDPSLSVETIQIEVPPQHVDYRFECLARAAIQNYEGSRGPLFFGLNQRASTLNPIYR